MKEVLQIWAGLFIFIPIVWFVGLIYDTYWMYIVIPLVAFFYWFERKYLGFSGNTRYPRFDKKTGKVL